MSPAHRLITPLALLLLIAGCEKKTPEAEFYSDALAAVCAWGARCGWAPDEAACTAALTPAGGVPDTLGPNVVFDPAQAAECLEAMRALPCAFTSSADERRMKSACDAALHGTVPAGGSCVASLECVSGDCQVDPSCANQCCSGTCHPSLTGGNTCAHDSPDPATYCDEGTACNCLGGTCRCRPRVSDGETCDTRLDCPDGSACALSRVTFEGVCMKPLPVDAPCTGDRLFECDVDLDCDPTTHRCASRLPVGASCTAAGLSCAFGLCQDGTCESLPTDGEACTFQCALGYDCTNGRCTRTPFCL